MNKTYRFLVCLTFALICCGTSASTEVLRTVAFSENQIFGTGDHVFLGSPVLNNLGQTAFSAGGSLWLKKDDLLTKVARAGDSASNGSELVTQFGPFLALNNSSQTAFVSPDGLWLEERGALAFLDRDHQSFSIGTGAFAPPAPSLNDAGQIAFQNNTEIWLAENGSLESIARSGEIAPGTTNAFRNFLRITRSGPATVDNRPVLNNLGQTAFHGLLEVSDPDSGDSSAVWKGGVNSLELVARAGDPAPGTEVNFSTHDRFSDTIGPAFSSVSFFIPAINDAGQTAFRAYLDDGPDVDESNNEGLWSERNGSLALVARTGDLAPETDHVFVSFDNIPVLNSQGQTAFRAVITDPENKNLFEAGIWSERDGVLKLVARTGDPAIGGDSASFYRGGDFPLQDFGIRAHRFFSSPVINEAGQVAFMGNDGVTFPGQGIWAQDSQGLLKLIVKTSDQIDVDDGPGIDFRTVVRLDFIGGSGNEDGRPSGFNDRGQVAFQASFTDSSSGVFVSNLVAVSEPCVWVLLAVAGLMGNFKRCR